MISASEIAKLRAETGAGVMDCKKALEETKGDYEKAKKILAKNAAAIAKEKAEREAHQGIIECYCHGSKIGVVLELSCETDFVAKNDEFRNLAHDLAMQIASMNPKNLDELKKSEFIKDPTITIGELIEQAIGKIGENIQVKRFIRYELGEE